MQCVRQHNFLSLDCGTSFSMITQLLFISLRKLSKQIIHMSEVEKSEKKSGPKDKHYVRKDQDHEVKYNKKRKQPARKFGKSKEDA
jgi:hypothetical protein